MDNGAPGRSGLAAVFWLLTLLVGQAAALRLTLAGPQVRYQHYVSSERALGTLPPGPLLVLAIQLVVVLAGVFVMRGDLGRLLRGAGEAWRLVLIAVLCVLGSTALTRDVGAYAWDVAITSLIQLLSLTTVVLFAAALPPAGLDWVRRAADSVLGLPAVDGAPEPGGVDRFAVACAAWSLGVALVLALLIYERHPHVPDEVTYLMHARYFAAGLLDLPIPPVPDAFNLDLMTYEASRWFSPVPPGWPLILAAGVRLGVPWIVNPVLSGISVLLLYIFLRECYSRRTARLAVLLYSVSPWQLFLAMSFMTHTAALAAALAAAVCVGRLRRDPGVRWALAGGAAIGVVSWVRPLEGLIMALLLGFWSLGARGRRWRLAPSATLTLATIVAGAATLPYNRYLTGSARVMPIEAYTDRVFGPGANALGFGANRGLGWSGLDAFPGHGLRDVLANTNLNLSAANIELLGWATGSLVLLGFAVFGGRLRRGDWWMLAVIAIVTSLHHLMWFAGGPDFGARYWYLVLVPCVALAARGIERAEERTAGPSGSGPRAGAPTAAVLALVVGAVLLFLPWRAVNRYYHYRRMEPAPRVLALEHHFGRSLVLVRGNRHPDFASAAIYNPLDLRAPETVFAWDRNAATREAVLAAYEDRPVWILDGPSVTGAGWRIHAGPLGATQARLIPGALWEGR